MLSDDRSSITEAAKNQYRATLEKLSFEALYKMAWEEHKVRGKATEPKSVLIEKILQAKYD